MILVIIFAILTAFAIPLFVVVYKKKNASNAEVNLTAVLFGFSTAIFAICVLISLISNFPSQKRIVKTEYEETVKELTISRELLIAYPYVDYVSCSMFDKYNDDVKKFKENIIKEKKALSNPWINWLHCAEYKNCDESAVDYFTLSELYEKVSLAND